MCCHTINSVVKASLSPLGVLHWDSQCWTFSVRLACVRHAASVRPEPGSNSPIKFIEEPIWLLLLKEINLTWSRVQGTLDPHIRFLIGYCSVFKVHVHRFVRFCVFVFVSVSQRLVYNTTPHQECQHLFCKFFTLFCSFFLIRLAALANKPA